MANTDTYQGIPEAAREFCYMASAPSLNIPTPEPKVMVEGMLGSWELPTMEELMSPNFKMHNTFADGSWIPSGN